MSNAKFQPLGMHTILCQPPLTEAVIQRRIIQGDAALRPHPGPDMSLAPATPTLVLFNLSSCLECHGVAMHRTHGHLRLCRARRCKLHCLAFWGMQMLLTCYMIQVQVTALSFAGFRDASI